MEDLIMKKRLISIAVVLVALTVAWTAFAAREGGGGRAGGGARGGFGGTPGMSAEERTAMRERFQNMSEEEREKFREQMRARFEGMSEEQRAQMGQRFSGRGRMSREDQLKAIAAMQQQLAKLKAGIESSSPRTGTSFRDLSEEERTKLREQSTKARADREAAITALRAELDKVSPPRATPEQMATLAELREIRALAEKEKAAGTTKRLAALIEKQMQQMPRMGGRRGPGAPGSGEPGRPGAPARPGEGRRGQRGERGTGAGTGAQRRPAGEGAGRQ